MNTSAWTRAGSTRQARALRPGRQWRANTVSSTPDLHFCDTPVPVCAPVFNADEPTYKYLRFILPGSFDIHAVMLLMPRPSSRRPFVTYQAVLDALEASCS